METVTTSAGEVSFVVDGDPGGTPLLFLAHGAGADMHSEFMVEVSSGLETAGVATARFNFAYTEKGRKAPDPQVRLEATYAEVVDHLTSLLGPRSLFLGGKSMGGRIASHIADRVEGLGGLVFLGYPLHPPGKPERIRDAHLRDLAVPMLFVEGTRDPFCPLDTLAKVRSSLTAETEVAVIDDGDHSFKVRKSSGRSTSEAWEEVIGAVAGWVLRRAK